MSIPVPAKYIADFEKRGFGMFIHWGLYSQLAQGEWTMNLHHISQEKYNELFNNFTAEDFDAKKIVALGIPAKFQIDYLNEMFFDLNQRQIQPRCAKARAMPS